MHSELQQLLWLLLALQQQGAAVPMCRRVASTLRVLLRVPLWVLLLPLLQQLLLLRVLVLRLTLLAHADGKLVLALAAASALVLVLLRLMLDAVVAAVGDSAPRRSTRSAAAGGSRRWQWRCRLKVYNPFAFLSLLFCIGWVVSIIWWKLVKEENN